MIYLMNHPCMLLNARTPDGTFTATRIHFSQLAEFVLHLPVAASPDDSMAGDLQDTARFIFGLLGRSSDVIVSVKIDIRADEQDDGGVAWLNRLKGCVEVLDNTLAELLLTGGMKSLRINVVGSKLQEDNIIRHIQDHVFQSASQHPQCRVSARLTGTIQGGLG